MILAALFVLSGLVFAQGKGKGNGGGNGRGGGQHQGGNGNQGRGGKHAERGFPQAQPQPDFRGRGNGNGRQAGSPGRWGGQGGQIVVRQQPQQRRVEYIGPPVSDQGRGRGPDKRGRGNEKRERREFERQVRSADLVWNYDRRANSNRRDDDRDRSRRYRDAASYRVFQQYPVPRAWPNNYGAYRSAQVHERNERRKAEKEARKDWRRYSDGYSRYGYRDPYYAGRSCNNYAPYYADRNYYGYRNDWRDNLLRTVIGNVLNGGDPYYYSYQTYVPQTVYRPVYEPAYYSPFVEDSYRYSTAYIGNPYYGDDIVSSLGFGDSGFGGIVSRLFGDLLAVGYDDGYQAGQYARSRGHRDDSAYYDPYDPYVYDDVQYENIGYNPYSCLAENRRYLSEGYELGYQDGLRAAGGRRQFNELGNGSLDLVSVLLGNIL